VAATPSVPERPAPPVALAAASPASVPADRAATRPLLPLSQEAPPFPREAINAGANQGTVRARLSIDAAGRVTNVAIIDAQPRRVFDRAVTSALAYWTYEPGAPGRTTEVEVAFRRD
jgi:TonB family protein